MAFCCPSSGVCVFSRIEEGLHAPLKFVSSNLHFGHFLLEVLGWGRGGREFSFSEEVCGVEREHGKDTVNVNSAPRTFFIPL